MAATDPHWAPNPHKRTLRAPRDLCRVMLSAGPAEGCAAGLQAPGQPFLPSLEPSAFRHTQGDGLAAVTRH